MFSSTMGSEQIHGRSLLGSTCGFRWRTERNNTVFKRQLTRSLTLNQGRYRSALNAFKPLTLLESEKHGVPINWRVESLLDETEVSLSRRESQKKDLENEQNQLTDRSDELCLQMYRRRRSTKSRGHANPNQGPSPSLISHQPDLRNIA